LSGGLMPATPLISVDVHRAKISSATYNTKSASLKKRVDRSGMGRVCGPVRTKRAISALFGRHLP
jgi:hypothetical protein